jgi:formylglycine-generating enzyme required for sulfatase activity
LCALALLPGRLAVSQVVGKRLAVLEFKGTKIESEVLDNFSDEVRGGAVEGLAGRGVLVMTRESMLVLLKEMGKKECNEGDCEVETAKNIGADFVVSGSVAKIDGVYVVTLKLFETAKANLLATARIEAKSQLEVSRQLRQHGRTLAVTNIGPRPAPPPALATPVALPQSAGNCASNQIAIPSGTFWMGSEDGNANEKPVHKVTLSPYCIDKTEVTVAAYRACVQAGACGPGDTTVFFDVSWGSGRTTMQDDACNWGKANRDRHPINCVDWNQASAYCTWRGGRLPTEAEWEFAARGTSGRRYPWGDRFLDPTILNGGGKEDAWEHTAPVGIFPQGASPFGVLDMAGNVSEWTSDSYAQYSSEVQVDPRQPSSDDSPRVYRGGGWNSNDRGVSATFRLKYSPYTRYDTLGFRCARGAKM